MKENNILKLICYILIPILIIGVAFPLVYYSTYNKQEYKSYFSAEYFNSENFASDYMFDLENNKRQIVDVLYNDFYHKIESDTNTITYFDKNNTSYSTKAKDMYYMITYGNYIWTNVELTSETDTYEKLKNYIQHRNNENAKYVNIVNGNIETNSNIINLYGIQTTSTYKDRIYTVYKYVDREEFRQELYENQDLITETNNQEDTNTIQDENLSYVVVENEPNEPIKPNLVEPQILDNLRAQNPGVEITEDVTGRRIVFEFQSSKFNVYSSYIPEYEGEVIISNLGNILTSASRYENILGIMLPVSIILLLLIFIYLLLALGHKKGEKDIILNDLDKIPFECFLLLDTIVITLMYFLTKNGFFLESYNLFVNLAISTYFVVYILIALTTNTLIKRLKARKFWKYTVVSGIVIWFIKLFRICYDKIKNVLINILKPWKISLKIAVATIILISILIVNTLIFDFVGVFIDFAIIIIVIYWLIKIISDYEKIVDEVKRMYEGQNLEKIKTDEHLKCFKQFIEYINNIQNGYETAVREGIKSEKMKTDLITNVSHDIKTPLTSIINYVDLLKEEKIDNEKAKEYLNILENKSQRLKKLTEDLVEASKASSGNISLNIEKINVKELIKQSIAEFEDKFEAKNLIIEQDFSLKHIYINADNRYIYRVIENLFSNVSKYALEGTRVYIEGKTENGKAIISIKNISKEKLNITEEELMQRFVRGDKSRTTEGSGLGLSISESLTKIQKGEFKIKIDGDLFKVTLTFDEA